MAYDSATATDLALRAWQRAQTVAQTKRSRLNSQYGLTAAGDIDGTNTLGSIYQGNQDSVQNAEGAELSDRRRGFGGTGGLAGKSQAAADQGAQQRQAGMLQQANQDLADNTQENDFAGQDYQNQMTQIRANSAADSAETLRQNLLYGLNPDGTAKAPPPPPAPPGVAPGLPPSLVAARAAALKANPRIAQTARNRY